MGILMMCGRVGNKFSSMPSWHIYDFMIRGARMDRSTRVSWHPSIVVSPQVPRIVDVVPTNGV
jgi:hypothetical protein